MTGFFSLRGNGADAVAMPTGHVLSANNNKHFSLLFT